MPKSLPDLSTVLLPFRKPTASPMRVGVVFNGPSPLRWMSDLLEFLGGIPGLQTCALPLATPSPAAVGPPSWLTSRLYSASCQKVDPFSPVAFTSRDGVSVDAATIEVIRSAGCGVVIWLAASRPQGNPRELATHGIFTVALGQLPQPIPFWSEVANSETTSTVSIFWHDLSAAHGRLVLQAETSTSQGLYVTVNAEGPLIATIRLLAGLCLDMQRDPEACEEKLGRYPEQAFPASVPSSYPSILETSRFLVNKLSRSAYRRWAARGVQGRWFIAIRPNPGTSIAHEKTPQLSGLQEVPLPEDSQTMADPFLYEAKGRTFLFFEDEPAGKTRARLAYMEILENGRYSEKTVILERDYHLSYPCVVSSGSDIFLIPESSAANRVDLYRFSCFPAELELVSTFVEALRVVDTTPIFLNGRWYFFTTTALPFLESMLFSSDRLDGPWQLHPASPISCSVKNSRGAGNLFWRDGRLFRPTQDCSVSYGYAITVNEVTRLTPTEFAEHPVAWIGPTWSPGLLGTHTWNESSRFQVIDGFRYQS